MTLSRVRYADETLSIIEDIVLIKPINFSLLIIRNLCASWFKEVPDLNVSGSFKTINLSLSKEDYATLMRISTGNLAEGAPSQPRPGPPALPQAPPVDSLSTSPDSLKSVEDATTSASKPASSPTM
ncbi:vacuolar protein sorting-associated protein 13C-like [Diaphorina citri]|uniref:Vacuolar protein sorting-associated protein 13C-like n=1 Tax=Diaphorina citri TaxID=121845 RepID=A0A3Q0ITL5_DIACI|nr:vacuolar protein sorting-associated protein 13C-like [Diaphorina citri]